MLFGLISVTAGTPAITVNVGFTTCAPVVMVTVRAPVVAASSKEIGTEALVGPFTVSVPVVMSAPKLTVVVGPKLVLVPVITIVSFVPWCAEAGLSTALAVMVPVPPRSMMSGLGLEVLLTVIAPAMAPAMVGENRTSRVQVLPASTVPPVKQVVPLAWIPKSPVGTMLFRVTVLALLLVILTAFAALVVPTPCAAKVRLAGATVRLASEVPFR